MKKRVAVKSRKNEIYNLFNNDVDPIYVAMEHMQDFSIPFLAKSFVKEMFRDSIKFISKVL